VILTHQSNTASSIKEPLVLVISKHKKNLQFSWKNLQRTDGFLTNLFIFSTIFRNVIIYQNWFFEFWDSQLWINPMNCADNCWPISNNQATLVFSIPYYIAESCPQQHFEGDMTVSAVLNSEGLFPKYYTITMHGWAHWLPVSSSAWWRWSVQKFHDYSWFNSSWWWVYRSVFCPKFQA
jgi:hypothetical protein